MDIIKRGRRGLSFSIVATIRYETDNLWLRRVSFTGLCFVLNCNIIGKWRFVSQVWRLCVSEFNCLS